ncbi:MAG: class I SAM-dependent methyltransferase [Chlorobiaceae bacterium]|nr:class I SAM-dependent methyltransferase [Chlorobiaceae bacterium]NTV60266.1 class I SAM-dependent methyltransferase [Chlorobiaceae bacterium]
MASFYSEFAPYYEQVFPFREEVYTFLREFAGKKGDRLLDAGCGPGHYCGRFSSDGFSAEGIDLDVKMIAAATDAYPGVSFRCIDIAARDAFKGSFRMIYCIGNVLSHLHPSFLEPFLTRVHTTLEKGGCWVFQVVNWDYLLTLKEYFFPEKKIAEGNVSFFRSYPVISAERVVFDVRLVAGGATLFHDSSSLYPTTSDAYGKLHKRLGFDFEGQYAGFDKSVFDEDSNSGLVMVFRKP